MSPHPRSLLGMNGYSSSVSTLLTREAREEKTIKERNGKSDLANMLIGAPDGVHHKR